MSTNTVGGSGSSTGTERTGSVGSNTSKLDLARDSLRTTVESTPDAAVSGVASEIAGGTDIVRAGSTSNVTPPARAGELLNVHFAEAERFREKFAEADVRDQDPRAQAKAARDGDLRSGQDMRYGTLKEVGAYADGIADRDQREAFVRDIAPDAGRAAGLLSAKTPAGAYQALDRIGKDTSPETGRLLANSATQTGPGQDNLVPQGVRGSSVGNAFADIRSERREKLAEVAGGAARAVIPGVDAAVHLSKGELGAAAGSAAIDLAGGALLKGGKVAVGAVAAGVAMAPQDAQAGGLQRFLLRSGDEAFEATGRRLAADGGRGTRVDVTVKGRFADGREGALRLDDPRGKHTAISGLTDDNLKGVMKGLNRGRADPSFNPARNAGQFSERYTSVEGQAELARDLMSKVTPERLAELGKSGGSLRIELDRVVGLASRGNGQVTYATSVNVMRNGDGSFHLVPMP